MALSRYWFCVLPLFTAGILSAQTVQSRDLLPEHTFTSGMEGPAANRYGVVFAVNHSRQGTIGFVQPKTGKHGIFVELPERSVGNGIRIDPQGNMYVADYTRHHILKINPAGQISIFAHEPNMNQPNDLAITPNGNLYASDPNWAEGSGQLWLIRGNGEVVLLESGMGTTNGIEVSPDGQWLYVNESAQRNVWKYSILQNGLVGNKTLLCSFKDFGLDGMRFGPDGNLYLTRHGKGTVAVLDPKTGQLLREIRLKGEKPSNLVFSGKGGKTCYVTMADRGCFEWFELP